MTNTKFTSCTPCQTAKVRARQEQHHLRPSSIETDRPQQLPSPDQRKEPGKYLTARQAAEYLGVSYGTFRNWASQIRRCPGNRRYTREALDKFAATRRRR